ncbi:unnamed protein product [Ectocarpus sp. 12 AP-2014]
MVLTTSYTLRTLLLLTAAVLLSYAGKPASGMRISVVTGANKGIGLAIAKKLAGAPGHLCVLTSRTPSLGQKAVDDLKAEGLESVVHKQLDIGDPASVERFASELEQEFGRCDVLVNNAGIAFKGSDPTPFKDQAEPTLKTNFFDTAAFTEKMLPLVRKSDAGRVVNVASMAGHLSILGSQDRRNAFTNPALTKERLSAMMAQFVGDVKAGRHHGGGWPNTCYGMSKLGVIAYTKVAARVEREAGSTVTINACCPGYCDTDMTSHRGTLTPEEGARTPFMLTQMKSVDEGGLTGEFFRREALAEW